jgi:hypothetical protein
VRDARSKKAASWCQLISRAAFLFAQRKTGGKKMKDWISMAKGLAGLIALVAAAILYFAPNAKVEQLWARMDRTEINQEILFQKKVILMLKPKCGPQAPPGGCEHDEETCYQEAQHRLDELREEKKALEKK